MTNPPAVAVLGAGGTMGLAMSVRLARAGLAVTGWDRTPGRARPLADAGGAVAVSPASAVAGASVVVTMLSDADAVLAVMGGGQGALAAMADDAVWAQMSTIGEAGTAGCAGLARERGVLLADAPVLGTRQPAEQGQLVILAAGPPAARGPLVPVFDIVGRKTIWVGDQPGGGTQLKLVTNTWVLAVVEAGAEAIALAEGLGLEPGLLYEALDGGPLDLPYLRLKGRAMMARDFTPSFQLRHAAKDARLAGESAHQRELDLPLIQVLAERLTQGAKERGDLDVSATYLTSAPSA